MSTVFGKNNNNRNIVLLDHPVPDFVKLLDFGLAKCISKDGKTTQTGSLIAELASDGC